MKKLWKVLSILLALSLLAGMLCACGSKNAAPQEADFYRTDKYSFSGLSSAENNYGGMDMPTDAPTKNEYEPQGTVPTSDEKIIYTATYTLETRTFDKSYDSLLSLVKQYGGFLQSANVKGNNYYDEHGASKVNNRRATIVARIPAGQFEAFLAATGDIGSVIAKSQNAENVTSQFTDTEARIASLKVQEERLLELMAKAGDIKDLITLEDKLSDVRYEIESYQRTLNNYQSRIDYSTVTLYLNEVEVYTPIVEPNRSFLAKLWDSLTEGVVDFLDGLGEFAIVIVYLLPTLVLLFVLAVVVLLIIKKAKKKRAKKQQENK